jgi:hypothetical protein
MSLSLELNAWLSVAVVAFATAQILLWRTRQVLDRSQPAPFPNVGPVLATVNDVARPTTAS